MYSQQRAKFFQKQPCLWQIKIPFLDFVSLLHVSNLAASIYGPRDLLFHSDNRLPWPHILQQLVSLKSVRIKNMWKYTCLKRNAKGHFKQKLTSAILSALFKRKCYLLAVMCFHWSVKRLTGIHLFQCFTDKGHYSCQHDDESTLQIESV